MFKEAAYYLTKYAPFWSMTPPTAPFFGDTIEPLL